MRIRLEQIRSAATVLGRTIGAATRLARRRDRLGLSVRIAAAGVGLIGADRAAVGPALTRAGIVADYSKPLYVKTPCFDPAASLVTNRAYRVKCAGTADAIIKSVPLWDTAIARLRAQNVAWALPSIPPSVDTQLALMAAGIESDMGRLGRLGRGTTYEGLYQFSRSDTASLLYTQREYFLAILNAARPDIPVLAALPGDQVTFDQLLDDEVFGDTAVQVMLKLTSSYIANQDMVSRYPRYRDTPETYKIALGYVSHLLPAAGRIMARFPDCSRDLNSYTYAVEGKVIRLNPFDFSSNTGMFDSEGRANPGEVAARFWQITTPYLQEFGGAVLLRDQRNLSWPFSWFARTAALPAQPATFRPGQRGILSFLTGWQSDRNACAGTAQLSPSVPPSRAHDTAPAPAPQTVALDNNKRADYVTVAGAAAPLLDNNGEAARIPASTTKIMTLYLLFDEIKAGRLHLRDMITISPAANRKAPSRLIVPGNAISVENAIRAIVTRSANNIAAAVAEHIGGTETAFAERMTATAQRLGLSDKTRFVNATGLPERGLHNNTVTARDLAVLATAIERDFPADRRFFNETGFVFNGHTIKTHNHLVEHYDDIDGMKTGYTRKSGFNIVSTIKSPISGQSYIIVVMGGDSAPSRDRHVLDLACQHVPGFAAAEAKTCRHLYHDADLSPNRVIDVRPDNKTPIANRRHAP